MGLVPPRRRKPGGPGIVAVGLGLCIVAGCATPPPPHAEELSRIFMLRDRRDGGNGYLVQMLAFPDARVRKQATLALGAANSTDGINPLVRVAKEDSELQVRRAAAFALGNLPGPDRGKTLADLMQDRRGGVRDTVLSSVRPADLGCWQQVVDLHQDKDALVRGSAALALLRLCGGRRSGANKAVSPQQRQLAATLLRTALNEESEPEAHWRIVYALAHLAPGTGDQFETGRVLLAAAGNKGLHRWSRLFAIRALRWYPATAEIRGTLLKLLKNRDWALVYESMNVLAAPDPKVIVEVGKDPPPRYQDIRVVTELVLLRSHTHPVLREQATLLLGRYVDLRRLVVGVLRRGKSKDPGIRAATLQALTRLQRHAAVPDIDGVMRDPDYRVRVGAARALALLPEAVAMTRLRDLLWNRDMRVRTAALESLASFRHSDAALGLALDVAKVRDLALRETIANTLVGIGDPKAVPALIAAYKDSPGLAYAEARKLMVVAVGELGGTAKETVAFLNTAALDQYGAVRREAAKQLRRRKMSAPDTKDLDVAERATWITPRLGKDIPWSLLDTQPRLFCQTEQGSFILQLYPENAPVHCHSLLELVKSGEYQGRVFHRVVPGFVVQGGDMRGDGFGANPVFGGQLRDEFNPLMFAAGVLGMPKTADADTGGDQIFITTVPTPHLDRRYTAFGSVVRGMKVVERIRVGDRLLGISLMSH